MAIVVIKGISDSNSDLRRNLCHSNKACASRTGINPSVLASPIGK